MKIEEAKKIQERLAKEAIALLLIHSEGIGKADIRTTHYEEAITLAGKAWNIPMVDTARSLGLIRQEREVLDKLAAGKDASHVLPETELPMNATGAETLENVWALFETATRLDTRREREALFDLAGELAECQSLADWLKETPGEAQQQDSCPEMAMAM